MEQKTLWIIANWKSNKTIAEALDWLSIVGPKLQNNGNLPAGRQGIKVVVCSAFSCLAPLKKEIQTHNYPIILGSQDISPFGIGAYTGEESAALLNDLITFSIVGHSERRHNFGETDEMIANKTKQVLDNGMTVCVCVQGNETPVPEGCKLIAYEPISAISTGLNNTPGAGHPDNPDEANSVAEFFKKQYVDSGLEVLYGGSVNSENVASFVEKESINGVLVGNKSLDAEEFLKIIENCATV